MIERRPTNRGTGVENYLHISPSADIGEENYRGVKGLLQVNMEESQLRP